MISFVCFSPVLPRWERIIGALALDYRVTGWRDVMFRTDEDAGWTEFVHDLYPTHSRKRIKRKLDDLAAYPRAVRIISAEGDLEKRAAVKDAIRKKYADEVPIEKFITIHSSDTDDEAQIFWAMTHPVNVRHAKMRARLTEEFLHRMQGVRKDLAASGIPQTEACVVKGAVLEALGLRKAGDIDVIVSTAFRDSVEFQHCDLSGPGYSRCEVSDDEIIANPLYHFWVDGLKFASIDMVVSNKRDSRRKSDKSDMELIRGLR